MKGKEEGKRQKGRKGEERKRGDGERGSEREGRGKKRVGMRS